MTRYGYRDAISGFFEFPTDNARRILPKGMEPIEPHHGTSVLAMTVFDFTESEVGTYGEVVMSVIVAPLVKPASASRSRPSTPTSWEPPPRPHGTMRSNAGTCPTGWKIWTSPSSLRPGRMTARVAVKGEPVADLTIADHSWHPVSHLYQSFMKDDSGAYLANITMEGSQSEHEEEVGQITLHEHAFNASLVLSEIYERPFRELWMRDGVQTFDPLVQLQPV